LSNFCLLSWSLQRNITWAYLHSDGPGTAVEFEHDYLFEHDLKSF
jgi:hypothetical protein